MLKAGANQNRIVNGIYLAITNSSAADTLADSAPSESAISGDWPNNAICMSFPPSVNVLVLITSALLDGGKLMQIALLGQSPEMALSDGALSARVSAALLFVMASYMPLTILFWFAPALS